MSSLPQLILWYGREAAPALPEMVSYRLRTYQPGDEEGWLALLQANGELGRWDRRRLEGVLEETRVQLFIECEGQIVACTGCNYRSPFHRSGRPLSPTGTRELRPCWEIGWVAVHPDFQGRGLGKFIVGAAVAQAKALGPWPIYLWTDDFRIPALRCYLKLGFAPNNSHPSYPRRWADIFARLGEDYQALKPEFVPSDQSR